MTRRVLVCAPLLPEFDREGGSRRIYHFISFLREEGWPVTFISENALRGRERYERHLRQMGVATYVGFDDQAADAVATGGFDIAILAFWHLAESYADWIRGLSPQTAVIVESVDLHWLRNARRAFSESGPDEPGGGLDDKFGSELVREMNAYARADAVLTVSDKEADLINDIMAGDGCARAVPDCDTVPASTVGYDDRRGMLFIGNFRHPPNVDAVAFLCDEIVPRLPASVLRDHPLSVVGNGLDDRVRQMATGLSGIRMVGWVPSITPYLHAARVSVVPVRFGAGTKRKLMQAMMACTPSVSTSVGVEGFDLDRDDGVLVADRGVDFASSVTRLIEDRELWTRLAVSGRSRIDRAHGRDVVKRRFFEVLAAVVQARPARPPTAVVVESPDRSRFAHEQIRGAIRKAIPQDAYALVVSRGDPDLLKLGHCSAGHFPQASDGRYAGHHPADSGAAIDHLEALVRDRGAGYLVFPGASFWWLDHYADFARHLEESHTRVWSDGHCVVFCLAEIELEAICEPRFGRLSAPSGGGVRLPVRVVNKSNLPFSGAEAPVGLTYHLRDGEGRMVRFDNPRVYFDQPLGLEEERVVEVTIQVPEEPGAYVVELGLVREGHAWFAISGSGMNLVELGAT